MSQTAPLLPHRVSQQGLQPALSGSCLPKETAAPWRFGQSSPQAVRVTAGCWPQALPQEQERRLQLLLALSRTFPWAEPSHVIQL